MNFMGYRRSDGRVGTRNYVGVLSTVVCANEVARGIAAQLKGTIAFSHQQGCCQTPPDLKRVTDALIGLGNNPNLAAVLLVSLGCEGTDVQRVAQTIAATGKPVEIIGIQECGGAAKTTAKGILLAQQMAVEASRIPRVACSSADLVLGLKCGSSDTTSGLSSNPALGVTVERLIGDGGTVILGEVTEMIGAEHLVGEPVQGRGGRQAGTGFGRAHGESRQGYRRRHARRPADAGQHCRRTDDDRGEVAGRHRQDRQGRSSRRCTNMASAPRSRDWW